MAITDWPAEDRPREKLLTRGAEALTDAELLAIFLRVGCAGKSAVDLARDLLHEFGGLGGLFKTSRTRFCQTQGMGPAKYAQLQAVLEMARRHFREEMAQQPVFDSPSSVHQYLSLRLKTACREQFLCLFLDNQHRLIADEVLFTGTIDGAAVYPREVARRALELNAVAMIVAHNHPSGLAEPSVADQQITQQLVRALELIDIRLLDHIIVAGSQMVSLAERGDLRATA
ncbi:MAG: DNA repair protein RadC [Cellvibrionaceae bacterium]